MVVGMGVKHSICMNVGVCIAVTLIGVNLYNVYCTVYSERLC